MYVLEYYGYVLWLCTMAVRLLVQPATARYSPLQPATACYSPLQPATVQVCRVWRRPLSFLYRSPPQTLTDSLPEGEGEGEGEGEEEEGGEGEGEEEGEEGYISTC